MRTSLVMVALGLLAVTGCENSRPYHTWQDVVCELPYTAPTPKVGSPWPGSPAPVVPPAPAVRPIPGGPAPNALPTPPLKVPEMPRVLPDSAAQREPLNLASATETPTAQPRSVESHQTLTGTVQPWRNTWQLRYAPVDVEDANGGRVTLIGDSGFDQLQDGQRVRVRGTLIPNSGTPSTAPKFEVQSLEVVD